LRRTLGCGTLNIMDVTESRHHHHPCHRFVPEGTYFVTASTLHKAHLFQSGKAKDMVLEQLFELTAAYGWQLQAWAVLVNHYHFVALAPEDAKSLKPMLQKLHSDSAVSINNLHNTPGRQVCYQYWDVCITNERSHLARLHYVHTNPEKHRVARYAAKYKWCSMAWLLEQGDELAERILAAPLDLVNIYDDFD
jgi:putative transposase